MKTELNLEFYKLTDQQAKNFIYKKGLDLKIDDYFFDISEQEFDTIDNHKYDNEYIEECERTCIDRLMEICEKHEVPIGGIKELNIFAFPSDIENGIYYLCHACQALKIDYIHLFAFSADPKGYYECKLYTDLYRIEEIRLALDKKSYINLYTNMILFDEDINASNYSHNLETLSEIIVERIRFIWHTMNVLSSYSVSCTINLMIPKNIYKYLEEFGVAVNSLINEDYGVEIHCINKSGMEKIAILEYEG